MSMRILMLQSDWNFIRQARGFLENHGHSVVVENDPKLALARADHWKPDVVIVGADLAGVHKGDLLAQFKECQPRPALLLTAPLARFDLAWRAWQKGADEMIFTPLLHASELNVAIFTATENMLCPRRRYKSTAKALSA